MTSPALDPQPRAWDSVAWHGPGPVDLCLYAEAAPFQVRSTDDGYCRFP